MKYEGHFLLWYFILMPFAKLGFPYITTNIISCIITSISTLLILRKAPFKFYKRVLLIFTFPFLYLFPIISRCYCLIPLAIVLMCIFYKDRKQKPFRYLISVIMLANTHVIMLGMVGIVLLDYLLELIKDWKKEPKEKRIKRLTSLIIVIILLIVSILPLLGCLTTNKEIGSDSNILSKILYTTFYPFTLIMQIFNMFTNVTIILSFIIYIIFLFLFYEIKNAPLDYLKIGICVLWQCIIYAFIYGSISQRASTLIFILLYFKWISTYNKTKTVKKIEKRFTDTCLIILTFLNIINGLLNISFYEIFSTYSNAYEIANYTNEIIDDNSIILTGPRVEFTSSIIPYVNKNIKFYHIPGNRYFSYTIWDDKNKAKLCMEDIENLSNIFDKEQKLYYIYCKSKSKFGEAMAKVDEKNVIDECIEKGTFKEIYSTNKTSIYFEDYCLYEVILNNL